MSLYKCSSTGNILYREMVLVTLSCGRAWCVGESLMAETVTSFRLRPSR